MSFFLSPPPRLYDRLAFIAAVCAPLVVYVLTMPRTVVLEDDGNFLMVGAHLGIAHAPGYPLYTLLLSLFMHLPVPASLASPAFLGHLASAVLAALTAGMVYVCARLLQISLLYPSDVVNKNTVSKNAVHKKSRHKKRHKNKLHDAVRDGTQAGAQTGQVTPILLQTSRWPALAAAWLFAVSEHVWSQAIITEVYALHVLLFFTLYALLLYGVRHPQQARVWIAAAVSLGLSLANHWPLTLLTLPGLVVAVWPARRHLWRQLPLLSVITLATAALPYLLMIWRSLQNPLISFRGPLDSVQIIWRFISRQRYVGIDTSASAGWEDRIAFLHWFGNEVWWSLTVPGFLLAALGIVILFRQRLLSEAYSGALVFVGSSVVLLTLLSFDFELYKVALFRPYSLVCYGLAAVWLAVGLQFLLRRLSEVVTASALQKTSPRMFALVARPWCHAVLGGFLCIALTTASVHENWRLNDRADSDFASQYADMVFNFLPQDSVLLVYGDMERFVLGYYHFVEKRRTDILLLDISGLIFNNRLYSPDLPAKRRIQLLLDFIRGTKRPVFYTAGSDFAHGRGQRDYGFLKEVMTEGDALRLQLGVDAGSQQFFQSLTARRDTDLWERLQRNLLAGQYCRYLGFVLIAGNPELLQKTKPLFADAERSFTCLLAISDILLRHGQEAHWGAVGQWLVKAAHLQHEAMRKVTASRFFYLTGELHRKLGRDNDAIAAYRQSYSVYPHPQNKSIAALQEMGVRR